MTIPSPSPNYRTGKICYLEIPAIDIAEFSSVLPAGLRLADQAAQRRLNRFRRHHRRSERHVGPWTPSID